jgi:hypothetical protein
MELKTHLDVGKYIKDNLKNIVAIVTLLISLGVFCYSIYLFYSVAIQNKDSSDQIIINTQKELELQDEVIGELNQFKENKASVKIKVDRLDDPFQ